jgi:hypothetical protein
LGHATARGSGPGVMAGPAKEIGEVKPFFYFLPFYSFLLFLFIFIHKKELQNKWIHTKTIR